METQNSSLSSPDPDSSKSEPPRRKRRVLRHSHIIFLEILTVFALLAATGAGLLVWRLKQGPIDLGFARNYLQEALRVPDRDLTPTVEDIVLSWPDLSGPILLGFKNAKLFDHNGKAVFSVNEAALGLSKTKLLLGQISPVALILREPVVQVVRTKEGQLVFGIIGLESKPDVYGPHTLQEDGSVLERILRYIGRPGEQKQKSGLGTLEAFKIESARVVITDKTLDTSWVLPTMDASFVSEKEFLKTDLSLEFAGGGFMRANVVMPWDTKEAQAKAEIRGFDPWFFAQRIPGLEGTQKGNMVFDGQVAGLLDSEFMPIKMLAQLSSRSGKISNPDLFKEPAPYKDFSFDLSYDSPAKTLELANTHITLQDVTIDASAKLIADAGKISGPVRLSIGKIEQARIAELWPPMLEGDSSEEWIVKKLSKGTFTNLHADLSVTATKTENGGWAADVADVTSGFSFSGMRVDYRSPLIPVTEGKGAGTFSLSKDKLEIAVQSGKIADMTITDADLKFMRIVEKGKGVADLTVNLNGPLATGLKYLESEPIHMKGRFDNARVKGSAALKVKLDFPAHKDLKVSEVKVGVEGTLSDVFLPSVVKDMPFSGGPLALSVVGNDLKVSGGGKIGSATTTFEYNDFVHSEGQPYKFKVKAQVEADEPFRVSLGADLKDYLDGTVPAAVVYTEKADGSAEADINADLTPARAMVDPFDYEKKAGIEGAAHLTASMKDGDVREISNFSVRAPDLNIQDSSLKFSRRKDETVLAGGTFTSFKVLDSSGSMSFDVDENGRYAIKVVTPVFDLKPFLNEEERGKAYDEPPMLIDLTATKMKGVDGSTVSDGKIVMDIEADGRYNTMQVNAVAGKGAVALRYGRDESGIRSFKFDTADAGAALRAFGIYQNIRGGTLNIRGRAKSAESRDIIGSARLENFRVVNAPTLAQLISAMSLPGLLQLLGNEGLVFTKLEADYVWNSRAGGALLHIKDGRTSGNSVGFSFEGDVDLNKLVVNISGTMVPLSEVNKFIGKIPLVGDILTGGGGLIAATYTVKGPTKSPGVMVNPLSVLTPGILRKILFE